MDQKIEARFKSTSEIVKLTHAASNKIRYCIRGINYILDSNADQSIANIGDPNSTVYLNYVNELNDALQTCNSRITNSKHNFITYFRN